MKIVLVYPLAPSVERAVTVLLSEESVFTMQMARLGDFRFQDIPYSEPCIVLFSAVDLASRNIVRKLLESCPPAENVLSPKANERSPFFRIIVLGEETGGVAVQNWRQYGVHEFILGPIVSRALQMKLDRHRRKILQEIEDLQKQDFKVLEYAEDKKNDFVVNRSPSKPEFAVHGIVLGPNTFLFPRGEKDQEPRKIVVACEMPDLKDGLGQWVRCMNDVDLQAHGKAPGESNEAVWDWVYSKGSSEDQKNSEEDRSFRFIGEKPVFDSATGKWVFAGKTPLMFLNRLGAPPLSDEKPAQSEEKEMVFGYYSKCGLVMYRGHANTDSAKVWFVRIDDFSDSPLRFYQKSTIVESKRAKAAPGGINDSPDEDLLRALKKALKDSDDSKE